MCGGGEPILFGFLNSNIVQVPSWFYLASMALRILSGFGCKAYAPVMVNILGEIGADRHPKMYKVFRFGCASAPMMFVSFHTACCLTALFLQTAIKAGIDAESCFHVFRMEGNAEASRVGNFPEPTGIHPLILYAGEGIGFLLLIILIAASKTVLPRWMFLLSPGILFLLKPIVGRLPKGVRVIISGGWTNLISVIYYTAVLIVLCL